MYYASIFAKLETPDRRDDWLIEHGVGQSIPNGGPVFSYSCDDESKYRDLANSLADALENLIDWSAEGNYGHLKPEAYLAQDKARENARAALANYRKGE